MDRVTPFKAISFPARTWSDKWSRRSSSSAATFQPACWPRWREAEESFDEEPDLPEWQKREWETVKRIVSTDRFVRLPTQFDIHEWSIMEDFSHSVGSDRIRAELLNAIHGRGAFRHFKDTVHRYRIEQDWFKFRDDALRDIAIEWCEEHHIQWK